MIVILQILLFVMNEVDLLHVVLEQIDKFGVRVIWELRLLIHL